MAGKITISLPATIIAGLVLMAAVAFSAWSAWTLWLSPDSGQPAGNGGVVGHACTSDPAPGHHELSVAGFPGGE